MKNNTEAVTPAKVDVLGTEYEIIIDRSGDNPKLRGANAYIEFWSKKIVIAEFCEDEKAVEKQEDAIETILRHELAHAFFHESGLGEYAHHEILADWIALQFPKMAKAFGEVKRILAVESPIIKTKGIYVV